MQNLAVLFLGLEQNHRCSKTINLVLIFIQPHPVRTGPTPTSGSLYLRFYICSSVFVVNKYRVVLGEPFGKAFRHLACFEIH